MIEIKIFIICCFGAFIGSMSGLGGAVIIKPMLCTTLGLVSPLGVLFAKFIATTVVFVNSVMFSIKNNFNFGKKGKVVLYSSIGSIIGITIVLFMPEIGYNLECFLQGWFYLFIILIVWMQTKVKRKNYKDNVVALILFGIFMGFVSSLFGIGGGAIRVPVFMFMFSLTMKQSILCSFMTSMITEPFKLIQYTIEMSATPDMLTILILASIAAIAGALIGSNFGSKVSKKMTAKQRRLAFVSVLGFFSAQLIISSTINFFQ